MIKERERHFALKHAIKCALKGNVTLANVLEDRANKISPITEDEREIINDALEDFYL